MAMRTYNPNDTAVKFLSLPEISRRYQLAKQRFYTRRNLYQICRSHCKYGGSWPNKTRAAKLKLHESARNCRALQQVKQHLEARRAAVTLAD